GVSRPWNNRLCTPAPAPNESEPMGTLRVHALCLRLRGVCAMHFPFTLLTLRPGSSSSNVNCTVAALFSVNRNVVPTGGLAAAANLARWLPKRQRRSDWLTFVSVSAVCRPELRPVVNPVIGGGGCGGGGCKGGGCVVNVAVTARSELIATVQVPLPE